MVHPISRVPSSRVAFDASLCPRPHRIAGPDCFFGKREIAEHFNRFGFAWLRGPTTTEPRRILLRWQALFGATWQHARSDATGVALIAERSDRHRFGEEYLGLSPCEHPPHTDGAYHARPPEIVMLYCERPAPRGGHTVLVSGLRLFRALEPRLADLLALLAPDALTIVRDEQCSTTAVFPTSGRRRIVFRTDRAARLVPSPAALPACERLRREALDPVNQLRFTMQPGDLLVVDNTAVLHGRTAFEGTADPRQGRRLWRLAFQRSHSALVQGFDAPLVSAPGRARPFPRPSVPLRGRPSL